jgi:exopolysaccharide biosynthesis polyprenyl glycosylphosphotransferase
MESNRLFGPLTAYPPEAEGALAASARYGRHSGAPRLRRVLTHLALVGTDALVVAVAFYASWFLRYRLEWGGDVDPVNYVPFQTYVPLVALLVGIVVTIFHVRGFYRLPRVDSFLSDLSAAFAWCGVGVMLLFAFTVGTRYPAESRLTFIFAWPLATLLVVVGRQVFNLLLGWLHRRGLGTERVLVVGESSLARMILQSLVNQPHLGYTVVGYLGERPGTSFGRFACLGRPDEIARVVGEHGVEDVIIALPSASHERVMQIVDHCRRDGLTFKIVPDLYQMTLGQVDVNTVVGVPLIGLREVRIHGFNLFLKRAVDLLLTGMLLLVLALPMALIALAIKLDSHGPVIFRQRRLGRGQAPFEVYKFRSMRQDADQQLALLRHLNEADGPLFKIKADPRITRVGRWLRRLSLDELPQLVNVVKGDMSLVGPRPPLPREVAEYEPWHLRRLEVSPGVTGLWQVSGRSELSFDEMVLMDIYYIETWSLGLDVRILFRTLPAVLSARGAF